MTNPFIALRDKIFFRLYLSQTISLLGDAFARVGIALLAIQFGGPNSANTDKEYAAGLRYIFTKYFSLSAHYDSDMGLGAGFTITY